MGFLTHFWLMYHKHYGFHLLLLFFIFFCFIDKKISCIYSHCCHYKENKLLYSNSFTEVPFFLPHFSFLEAWA